MPRSKTMFRQRSPLILSVAKGKPRIRYQQNLNAAFDSTIDPERLKGVLSEAKGEAKDPQAKSDLGKTSLLSGWFISNYI